MARLYVKAENADQAGKKAKVPKGHYIAGVKKTKVDGQFVVITKLTRNKPKK